MHTAAIVRGPAQTLPVPSQKHRWPQTVQGRTPVLAGFNVDDTLGLVRLCFHLKKSLKLSAAFINYNILNVLFFSFFDWTWVSVHFTCIWFGH